MEHTPSSFEAFSSLPGPKIESEVRGSESHDENLGIILSSEESRTDFNTVEISSVGSLRDAALDLPSSAPSVAKLSSDMSVGDEDSTAVENETVRDLAIASFEIISEEKSDGKQEAETNATDNFETQQPEPDRAENMQASESDQSQENGSRDIRQPEESQSEQKNIELEQDKAIDNVAASQPQDVARERSPPAIEKDELIRAKIGVVIPPPPPPESINQDTDAVARGVSPSEAATTEEGLSNSKSIGASLRRVVIPERQVGEGGERGPGSLSKSVGDERPGSLSKTAGAVELKLVDTAVEIFIEHCVNCHKHEKWTRHFAPHYTTLSETLTSSVKMIYPSAAVFVNSSILAATLQIKKSEFPRLGAFEIFAKKGEGGELRKMFSKLERGRWPEMEMIMRKLEAFAGPPSDETTRALRAAVNGLQVTVDLHKKNMVKMMIGLMIRDGDVERNGTWASASNHILTRLPLLALDISDWPTVTLALLNPIFLWKKFTAVGPASVLEDFALAVKKSRDENEIETCNLLSNVLNRVFEKHLVQLGFDASMIFKCANDEGLLNFAQKFNGQVKKDLYRMAERVRFFEESGAPTGGVALADCAVECALLLKRVRLFAESGALEVAPQGSKAEAQRLWDALSKILEVRIKKHVVPSVIAQSLERKGDWFSSVCGESSSYGVSASEKKTVEAYALAELFEIGRPPPQPPVYVKLSFSKPYDRVILRRMEEHSIHRCAISTGVSRQRFQLCESFSLESSSFVVLIILNDFYGEDAPSAKQLLQELEKQGCDNESRLKGGGEFELTNLTAVSRTSPPLFIYMEFTLPNFLKNQDIDILLIMDLAVVTGLPLEAFEIISPFNWFSHSATVKVRQGYGVKENTESLAPKLMDRARDANGPFMRGKITQYLYNMSLTFGAKQFSVSENPTLNTLVCATTGDMNSEREILNDSVLPAIRNIFLKKKINFDWVDQRLTHRGVPEWENSDRKHLSKFYRYFKYATVNTADELASLPPSWSPTAAATPSRLLSQTPRTPRTPRTPSTPKTPQVGRSVNIPKEIREKISAAGAGGKHAILSEESCAPFAICFLGERIGWTCPTRPHLASSVIRAPPKFELCWACGEQKFKHFKSADEEGGRGGCKEWSPGLEQALSLAHPSSSVLLSQIEWALMQDPSMTQSLLFLRAHNSFTESEHWLRSVPPQIQNAFYPKENLEICNSVKQLAKDIGAMLIWKKSLFHYMPVFHSCKLSSKTEVLAEIATVEAEILKVELIEKEAEWDRANGGGAETAANLLVASTLEKQLQQAQEMLAEILSKPEGMDVSTWAGSFSQHESEVEGLTGVRLSRYEQVVGALVAQVGSVLQRWAPDTISHTGTRFLRLRREMWERCREAAGETHTQTELISNIENAAQRNDAIGSRIIYVTGQPGSGKTTILSQLAMKLSDGNFTMVFPMIINLSADPPLMFLLRELQEWVEAHIKIGGINVSHRHIPPPADFSPVSVAKSFKQLCTQVDRDVSVILLLDGVMSNSAVETQLTIFLGALLDLCPKALCVVVSGEACVRPRPSRENKDSGKWPQGAFIHFEILPLSLSELPSFVSCVLSRDSRRSLLVNPWNFNLFKKSSSSYRDGGAVPEGGEGGEGGEEEGEGEQGRSGFVANRERMWSHRKLTRGDSMAKMKESADANMQMKIVEMLSRHIEHKYFSILFAATAVRLSATRAREGWHDAYDLNGSETMSDLWGLYVTHLETLYPLLAPLLLTTLSTMGGGVSIEDSQRLLAALTTPPSPLPPSPPSLHTHNGDLLALLDSLRLYAAPFSKKIFLLGHWSLAQVCLRRYLERPRDIFDWSNSKKLSVGYGSDTISKVSINKNATSIAAVTQKGYLFAYPTAARDETFFETSSRLYMSWIDDRRGVAVVKNRGLETILFAENPEEDSEHAPIRINFQPVPELTHPICFATVSSKAIFVQPHLTDGYDILYFEFGAKGPANRYRTKFEVEEIAFGGGGKFISFSDKSGVSVRLTGNLGENLVWFPPPILSTFIAPSPSPSERPNISHFIPAAFPTCFAVSRDSELSHGFQRDSEPMNGPTNYLIFIGDNLGYVSAWTFNLVAPTQPRRILFHKLPSMYGTSCALSPNEMWGCVGSAAGSIFVYEFRNSNSATGLGRILLKIDHLERTPIPGKMAPPAPGSVISVGFSSDGSHIVAVTHVPATNKIECHTFPLPNGAGAQRADEDNDDTSWRPSYHWKKPEAPPLPPKRPPPIIRKIEEIVKEKEESKQRVKRDIVAARQWLSSLSNYESLRLSSHEQLILSFEIEKRNREEEGRRRGMAARIARVDKGRPPPEDWHLEIKDRRRAVAREILEYEQRKMYEEAAAAQELRVRIRKQYERKLRMQNQDSPSVISPALSEPQIYLRRPPTAPSAAPPTVVMRPKTAGATPSSRRK